MSFKKKIIHKLDNYWREKMYMQEIQGNYMIISSQETHVYSKIHYSIKKTYIRQEFRT